MASRAELRPDQSRPRKEFNRVIESALANGSKLRLAKIELRDAIEKSRRTIKQTRQIVEESRRASGPFKK